MSRFMNDQRLFIGVWALLFAASAAATIAMCASMRAMGGMPMPGGWTMSMMWMRMPGHSWAGSAASFVSMWTVMMAAMMLPSLLPILLRFRARVAGTRRGLLTMIVGAGYFLVWTAVGVAVFIAGVMLAKVEMLYPAASRAVPAAGAVVVVIAVSLQFTAWKNRRVSRCCEGPPEAVRATRVVALRHGIRLGLRCVSCCANWNAILLVVGMMDLRAMAVITAAITVERLRQGA